MRMWNVIPALLCDKHLLGEHVEMHMFKGCITKGKKLDGYIKNGLVDLVQIAARHEFLSFEMQDRGMKHNSKLSLPTADEFMPYAHFLERGSIGTVNSEKSLQELQTRCPNCKDRILTAKKSSAC